MNEHNHIPACAPNCRLCSGSCVYIRKCYQEKVEKIRCYLQEHTEENITLPELSQQFDMTLTLMKSCFKSIHRMPVNTFYRQQKMQKAAALLASTRDRVTDIAGQVGYSNTSKFSAAFKRAYGATPIEYRRRHRGEIFGEGGVSAS